MVDRNPLVPRARALRRTMTDAEALLWTELRRRQVYGARFRRQVPIGPYIADFARHNPRLVIEVDGSQHAESMYDDARDAYLTRRGFTVVRFWNGDVLSDLHGVVERIGDEVLAGRRRSG